MLKELMTFYTIVISSFFDLNLSVAASLSLIKVANTNSNVVE